MKPRYPYLTLMCVSAAVLSSLTRPSRSEFNLPSDNSTEAFTRKNDSEKLLTPVASDQDFVVKFKGEVISLRSLLQLVKDHNITIPYDTTTFLDAVLNQNQSAHSCAGRCFFAEERNDVKSCYCHGDCKNWGDCCLDFNKRCGATEINVGDLSLDNLTCGDINDLSWSGVPMKSTCSLPVGYEDTHECEVGQELNMTLQKELPVFDRRSNATYRNIACARCNNGEKVSFWGLRVTCRDRSQPPRHNITALRRFVENNHMCFWNYEPLASVNYSYQHCVVHDSKCGSDSQLPVMSVVKEVCASYSMVFSHKDKVGVEHFYRNPHCAICNPDGKREGNILESGGPRPPLGPPLTILLDVRSTIVIKGRPQVTQPPTLSFNFTSQMFNCSLEVNNCTVTYGGKTCLLLTSMMNTTVQMDFNTSRVVVLSSEHDKPEKNTFKPKENAVFILCPGSEDEQSEFSLALIYITFTGGLLSITSLCFLLAVYLSFKELKNLPGKCLINLSCSLLCYQTLLICSEKSKEVEAVCKAVAICLHFFVLASFSWMSVMAFDIANTFKVQVRNTRRQASDIRKTFIKYCVVGWGLPVAAVLLSVVFDFTDTLYFGYGDQLFYCWISDQTAIAVAMVTPVSLALVFNAVCLTKNTYAIHQLQQGAGLAADNNSRVSLLLICIKLTTVMGLTWILTLLTNWKQTALLQYPATVLNNLQGFFITLCFITTKRVRNLIKEKLRNRFSGPAAKHNISQTSRGGDSVITTSSITFKMTSK